MSSDESVGQASLVWRNVYSSQEFKEAQQELDESRIDGQEAWLLGRLYDLIIEILEVGGWAQAPDGDLSIGQTNDAQDRTFVGFLESFNSPSRLPLRPKDIDLRQSSNEVRTDIHRVVRDVVKPYLDALRAAQEAPIPSGVLRQDGRQLDVREQVASWVRSLKHIADVNSFLSLFFSLSDKTETLHEKVDAAHLEAEAACKKLETQTEELKELRLAKANTQLASYFKSLSKAECRKGLGLRVLSGVVLAVALIIAAWGSEVTKEDGVVIPDNSWTSLSHRLAIALLLTGAAAYAARLASSHYALGQWAKAIEVQLESVEGYIGVVKDHATRDRIREEFGRRVLGPPPPIPEGASTGMTAAELAQVLSTLRPTAEKG